MKKYVGLWAFVWLQFYYFFAQLQVLSVPTLGVQVILVFQVLYCLPFIVYFFCLMNRKITVKWQKYFELYFIVFGLLLACGILGYHLTNSWLFQEASVNQIILEMGNVVGMVVSMVFASFFHFFKKEIVNINDRTLWNTDKTFDVVFLSLFSLSAFALGFNSSKIIPYVNRNYYEFLRIFLVLVIILRALNKNRLFVFQRSLFYSVLIGYFIACSIDACITLFIFNPLLYEQLIEFGTGATRVVVSDVLTLLNWFILGSWVIWDLHQEDKTKKLQR